MSLLTNSREVLFKQFVDTNFTEKEKKQKDIQTLSLKKLLFLQKQNALQEDLIHIFFKCLKKNQSNKDTLKDALKEIFHLLKKNKIKNILFYEINSTSKKIISIHQSNTSKLPIKINLNKQNFSLLKKNTFDEIKIKKLIFEDNLKDWNINYIEQGRHKGLLLLQVQEENSFTKMLSSLLITFFSHTNFDALKN